MTRSRLVIEKLKNHHILVYVCNPESENWMVDSQNCLWCSSVTYMASHFTLNSPQCPFSWLVLPIYNRFLLLKVTMTISGGFLTCGTKPNGNVTCHRTTQPNNSVEMQTKTLYQIWKPWSIFTNFCKVLSSCTASCCSSLWLSGSVDLLLDLALCLLLPVCFLCWLLDWYLLAWLNGQFPYIFLIDE
jgi:hypothetical protein